MDNMPAFHRGGDKPLPEPMLTIHWRIYATLCVCVCVCGGGGGGGGVKSVNSPLQQIHFQGFDINPCVYYLQNIFTYYLHNENMVIMYTCTQTDSGEINEWIAARLSAS